MDNLIMSLRKNAVVCRRLSLKFKTKLSTVSRVSDKGFNS